jgi:hypothetical protein
MMVSQPLSLSDKAWFSGIYKKIYELIAMEDRLPPPDEILILGEPPEELRSLDPRKRIVYGIAKKDKMSIWFRDEPPHPYIYAHELAHLTSGDIRPRIVGYYEEIYADSIARIALVLVNWDIKPPVNPIRLFEEISLRDIADAMRKRLGLRGEDKEVIEQYYEIKGIIPIFADVKIYGGRSKIKIEDNYPHEILTLYVLSSLIDAVSIMESSAKPEVPELDIIMDLLNRLVDEEDDLIEGWDEEEKIWKEIEDEEEDG